MVETTAVAEMMKYRMNQGKRANLTFFRDSGGFEVDTIADWKHTFAVEIKSSVSSESRLSANTRKYAEMRKDTEVRNAVFYLGDISMNVNETAYISWKEWGDYFSG